MEEYKVSVTTKVKGSHVVERMITVRGDTLEEAEALIGTPLAEFRLGTRRMAFKGS